MGNTCKPMAVSFQCVTKSTTNKNKLINLKKKRKQEWHCNVKYLYACSVTYPLWCFWGLLLDFIRASLFHFCSWSMWSYIQAILSFQLKAWGCFIKVFLNLNCSLTNIMWLPKPLLRSLVSHLPFLLAFFFFFFFPAGILEVLCMWSLGVSQQLEEVSLQIFRLLLCSFFKVLVPGVV